ncbi:unnamed protein product [Ceratitis capitata]|uniref:(Mediterranean fruit fly) hypothetical protein n=1 Tax=Ceratitis capitata TaxID=7213 RepID=A0A811UEI1_CERCA|nr:unnamed protein product [Ceratitis capitata]
MQRHFAHQSNRSNEERRGRVRFLEDIEQGNRLPIDFEFSDRQKYEYQFTTEMLHTRSIAQPLAIPLKRKFLINNGALITIDTNKPNCEESLLHCAVRANALECVQLFIVEGADVNSLKPNGTNAIHLAADLGNAQCLEALLNAPGADANVRICIPLHLAADEGNVECVDLLLAKGADAKLKNHRGFTALHLAARTSSLECVESLLRNGSADPMPKISIIVRPCMRRLWGANVNHKDIYGFTALHLAALDGLAQCVEMLIFHGADVTTKSKKGLQH